MTPLFKVLASPAVGLWLTVVLTACNSSIDVESSQGTCAEGFRAQGSQCLEIGHAAGGISGGASSPKLMAGAPLHLIVGSPMAEFRFENDGGAVANCSSQALPAGLVVVAKDETCAISGLPTKLSPIANYEVVATTSGGDSATGTVSIEVVQKPASPQLLDAAAQNYVTNVAVSPWTFLNNGVAVTACSIQPALPEGLTIAVSVGSCQIAGTPVVPQTLTMHTVTATATDGTTDTASVAITVTDHPKTPVVQLTPELADAAAQIYSTTVLVTPLVMTNTGGPATACSVLPPLPAGLALAVNGSTCAITGTPTVPQSLTTHTLTATGSDASTDDATIDITVNAASPPNLANASAQTYVRTVAIAPLAITNTGAAATACSVLPPLPAGLTVASNAGTCRITGTPTITQSLTTHTITASAADGSTDSATVDLTVIGATPPNLANLAAQIYVTTVPVSPLAFINSGAPASACSVTPPLPSGLSVSVGAGTCRIMGTPTATHSLTTYTVTAIALDGSTDEATIDVTVNAATPPNLVNASAQTYVTTVAIAPVAFSNTGAAVTSCVVAPALPAGLTLAVQGNSCRITGSATATQSLTTHTVTAAAADGSSDTATIDITVNAANPPNIADAIGQTFTRTVLILAPPAFTNTGAAATACSVLPALPAGIAVSVSANTCRISGTPTATQSLTTHTVTATAADGSIDTATMNITVNSENPPIVADAAAQTYVTTVAIAPLVFTNTGAAVVACSVMPVLPSGLNLSVNANTCRITGAPTATQSLTTHTVTAQAIDGSADTATVNITVNAATPPSIADASAQTYVTTVPVSPLAFTNTGAAATACSVLPALPTGLTVAVNAGTCRITGAATVTQSLTTHTVTATAADGSADTATVNITVNAATPPSLADASAQTYVTTVLIAPLAFTNTGAAVTICSVLPALPAGLTLALNASTCRITGTPTVTQSATTHTVTATAVDGSTDTATVSVTVNAASPPNLADASAQTYLTTVPISPLVFTNIGAAATACSVLPALPAGLTLAVNASTCRITGAATATETATTHTVTATAADGSIDTATVDITVNASTPPNLANASAQTYITLAAITPLAFTNTGAAATSCSVLPILPTGLTVAVNANTCRITGTPMATQSLTTHTVTATAADGSTDTATVDVTVVADAADDCVWSGATSIAWADPSNWSGCSGNVPNSNDTIRIPVVSNQPSITASASVASVKSGAGGGVIYLVGANVSLTIGGPINSSVSFFGSYSPTPSVIVAGPLIIGSGADVVVAFGASVQADSITVNGTFTSWGNLTVTTNFGISVNPAAAFSFAGTIHTLTDAPALSLKAGSTTSSLYAEFTYASPPSAAAMLVQDCTSLGIPTTISASFNYSPAGGGANISLAGANCAAMPLISVSKFGTGGASFGAAYEYDPNGRIRWAMDCVWSGTTSTSWSTASNWSACGGQVPSYVDNVRFPAAPANQPTISASQSVAEVSAGVGGGTLTVAAGTTLTIAGGYFRSDLTLKGDTSTCTTCVVMPPANHFATYANVTLDSGITFDSNVSNGSFGVYGGGTLTTNVGAAPSSQWPKFKKVQLYVFQGTLNVYGLYMSADTSDVRIHLNGSGVINRFENITLDKPTPAINPAIKIDGCNTIAFNDSYWDGITFNGIFAYNVYASAPCSSPAISIGTNGTGAGSIYEYDPTAFITWIP